MIFSFKEKKWHNKGVIVPEIIDFAKSNIIRTTWTNEYLFLYGQGFKKEIMILSPFENKYYSIIPEDDNFYDWDEDAQQWVLST
jgi:hypothetical protein